MLITDRIRANREQFLRGEFNFIPLPAEFGILSEWYPGTMRGEYVGITGGTSSAKSQVTRRMYLYGAIEFAIRNKMNMKVLWFGLEESKQEAQYYLMSWLIHKISGKRYNIEDFEGIGKVMEEHDLYLLEKVKPVFDQFWSYIEFYDGSYNPLEIQDEVLQFAAGRGKFSYKGVEVHSPDHKTKIDEYRPNDPKEFVLTVIDHLALLDFMPGENSDRVTMIKMSKTVRQVFCKLLNYIGVAVLQQMSAMESLEHIKADMVYASLQGIGDAKTVARDMMTILGITNLNRYGITTALTSQKEIDKGKIDLKESGIGDAQRVIGILKRRYGIVGRRSLVLFDGCVGEFKGIRTFEDITAYANHINSHVN